MFRKFIKRVPGARWFHRKVVRARRNVSEKLEGANFEREFEIFKSLAEKSDQRFEVSWTDRNARLGEKTATHDFDRHYLYHTAWAMRVLASTKPSVHVDIASQIFFAAHLSAFIPVEFYEYRPPNLHLPNFTTSFADLHSLPFADRSVDSLSCMSVVEHIGLGRYGDKLDPLGDLKACGELSRVLASGGTLLYVVPVGKSRLEFNAHRVYSFAQVLASFPDLVLKEYALIPDHADDGHLVLGASSELTAKQHMGCGCFWFQRPLL